MQDTVERHGGLDVVMKKIVQREQENPVSNGRALEFLKAAQAPGERVSPLMFTHRGEPLDHNQLRRRLRELGIRAVLSEFRHLASIVLFYFGLLIDKPLGD